MYDENKAKRVINFISSLKHTKGKWHGKSFDLLPWQQNIIKKRIRNCEKERLQTI